MKLSELTAISPIDGRYATKIDPLRNYFSEYALIKYRILVEISWFQFLAEHHSFSDIKPLTPTAKRYLRTIIKDFNFRHAKKIKIIEDTTKHDVKSVEYFLKELLDEQDELKPIKEFIHFACTSEDINNVAYGLMIQEGREECIKPLQEKIIDQIKHMAELYAGQAMLAKTHGQTATPTTIGKEMANFAYRLQPQFEQFHNVVVKAKFNGAVGNYNAHLVAYPDIDWPEFTKEFIESLHLTFNPLTTQIEPHDYIAELADAMIRFNTTLIDLCRDIWGYISLGYFQQKMDPDEVGSSTMPHKINPIDFENAEGNLGMANAILTHLSQKLPISRWQRDLTDSTVLRNLGVAFGHACVSYQSLINGLRKLDINQENLAEDLEPAWEVLAEPIQTMMRCYDIDNPYEQLKTLTRGRIIDQKVLHEFIDTLDLPDNAKGTLKELTPQSYIGYAQRLAKTVKGRKHIEDTEITDEPEKEENLPKKQE